MRPSLKLATRAFCAARRAFLNGFMSWRALKPDPRANMSSEYERTFDPHTWTFVLPDLRPPIYIMHSSAADSALYYSYPNLTFTTKSKPIELLSGSFVQRVRTGRDLLTFQKCPHAQGVETGPAQTSTLPYKRHLCPTLLTLPASLPERHIKGHVHSGVLCSLKYSRAATDPQILTFKPSGGKSKRREGERKGEMGEMGEMRGKR